MDKLTEDDMKLPDRTVTILEKLNELVGAVNNLTAAVQAAPEVTGVRDDPESALKSLLDALNTAGIITDSTTATAA